MADRRSFDPGHVVLQELHDDRGSMFMGADRLPDGSVRIEGQDLGSRVSDAFGPGLTEYEWTWTLDRVNVPAATVALGGGPSDDILERLRAWTQANGGRDPGQHLRDAGVPIRFWSRIGD